MKCVHHYVLKPGDSAIGQCKHCSHIRTFDSEYKINRTWAKSVLPQAPEENASE